MKISLSRILFPTDFSDASKEAEAYAVALADRFGAELHLLHVVSQVMPYTDASSTWVMPPPLPVMRFPARYRQFSSRIKHEGESGVR